MKRIEVSVNKILAILGPTLNLFKADFFLLEKLAILLSIEKALRKRIDNYNPEALYLNGDIFRILLRIKDKMPVITGYLTKARLFSLVENTWDGYRLIRKSNLLHIMKEAFPHCFEYHAADCADVEQSKLVSLFAFHPTQEPSTPKTVVKAILSQQASALMSTFVRWSLFIGGISCGISFGIGAIYGWALYSGIKRLQ
jgi:hypothetical protein